MIDQINALGYGLTLGIQTRIDSRALALAARARVGNVYVNRNMIGAVVGVQPFGGEGLSGTGPKAGGPHYLYRFCAEQTLTINTAAAGGNVQLLASRRGLQRRLTVMRFHAGSCQRWKAPQRRRGRRLPLGGERIEPQHFEAAPVPAFDARFARHQHLLAAGHPAGELGVADLRASRRTAAVRRCSSRPPPCGTPTARATLAIGCTASASAVPSRLSDADCGQTRP